MIRHIVDVHVLQTVPPSNLNRDDTGSPKTAVYGGVRRARVSSQAWKRATRQAFATHLDVGDLGVRTKRVVEIVTDEVARQAPDLQDQAGEIARTVLTTGGLKLTPSRREGNPEESSYMIFLSRRQIHALAQLGVAARGDDGKLGKAAVKKVLKADNSVDLALFGRMVADDTDLNVDASAQVAHAISVHAVDNEYDYFTAVDDHKQADEEEDAGAGMIGTVEFNSATLYRYATINMEALDRNLGDAEAARRAVIAFVRSFVTSMPTGKQNTFANRTLPDAVVVSVRSDQPVSWVGAFEDAIDSAPGEGRVRAAADRLARYAKDVDAAFGEGGTVRWVVGVGDRVAALDQLGERLPLDTVLERLAKRLGGEEQAS